MRIAVLHPSYEGSTSVFKDYDYDANPAAFYPGHIWDNFHILKPTAVDQVEEIVRRDYDMYVQLCDGASDEDRAGVVVVETLERLNVPFTGADSGFFEPTRPEMKAACRRAGGLAPAYVMARTPAGADQALKRLRFPMLVKHPNSYGSIGLTRDSRVSDAAGLRRETARMVKQFGAALIEEFIEGREFTVLVAERRRPGEPAWALPALELVFPAGETFQHMDLKWVHCDCVYARRVTDRTLDGRLRRIAAGTFAEIEGTGYGRCDFRVDAQGRIYLLEINPNCALFWENGMHSWVDWLLATGPVNHQEFLDHLFVCAHRRCNRAAHAALASGVHA